MNCMRCGREVTSGNVFCEDCLTEAGKYPVNPDTPVHLPRRVEAAAAKKQPKKKVLTPEEQVKLLKPRLKWLALWSVIATLAAMLLAYPAILYLKEDHFDIGQNYKSFTTAATDPTEITTP